VTEYRLTPRAREGLARIVLCVELRFGPAVADRVLHALDSAFSKLADSPGPGHLRPDLTEDERIRFWPVGPTLVAYREGPQGLEVLFVERGDVDWERRLHELI
jgi:plasmid stabilization system protein ParE